MIVAEGVGELGGKSRGRGAFGAAVASFVAVVSVFFVPVLLAIPTCSVPAAVAVPSVALAVESLLTVGDGLSGTAFVFAAFVLLLTSAAGA